jgi:hypothetical protein
MNPIARTLPFGRSVSALGRASVVVVLEEVVVSGRSGGEGIVEVAEPEVPLEVDVVLATVSLVATEAVVDGSSSEPQPTTPERETVKTTAAASAATVMALDGHRHDRRLTLGSSFCLMMPPSSVCKQTVTTSIGTSAVAKYTGRQTAILVLLDNLACHSTGRPSDKVRTRTTLAERHLIWGSAMRSVAIGALVWCSSRD